MAKSAKRAKSTKSAKAAKSTRSSRKSTRTSSSRSTKTARSTKSARGGRSAGGAKKKSARRPNAAFMAPVSPSPALSEVVGSKPIPRTEVTKRLWAYIKKKKLQDQKNKRMIKADATL